MKKLVLTVTLTVFAAACGDDGGGHPTIDNFLPPIPAPTGGAQSAFAGRVTADNQASELFAGTAAAGRIGDWFLRNDRVRFILQHEGDRAISPVPYGGSVIDADFAGSAARGDRWGELSLIYSLGRTMNCNRAELLADGARGGAAAIRFRGIDAVNDYINLKGLFPALPPGRDPNDPLPLDGAVTYILEPGASHLRALFTLFNHSGMRVSQPLGTLCDAGSETELLRPGLGYGSLPLTQILTAPSSSVPYQVVSGSDIAYGVVPLIQEYDRYGLFGVQGVPVMLFNMTSAQDIFDNQKSGLSLEPYQGKTYELAFVVASDAAGIDAAAARLRGQGTQPIAGRVTDASGMPVAGAHVTLYTGGAPGPTLDANALPWTFFKSGVDGSFGGEVAQGSYVAQARITIDRASAVVAAGAQTGLVMPGTASWDWTVLDADTMRPMPARLTVIGRSDAGLGDGRLGEPKEAQLGIVRTLLSRFGTSTTRADADGADARLELLAGRSYRIVASRGPEWSLAMARVANVAAGPQPPLTFTLKRVVDTSGYVSTDFHQHSANSPDSFIAREDRIRSYLADGLEFFASSDHDFLTDYTPEIRALRAESLLAQVVGVECTPFDYGHFGAYPIPIDPMSSTGGAFDWGGEGTNVAPGDIFAAYRAAGALAVQVNHPRVTIGEGFDFMQNFDRAALAFDFVNRTFYGDKMAQRYSNADLRIPEEKSLFSDRFDVLELWNGFDVADSNQDGLREQRKLDIVLRDWFNFLSFGFRPTAVGNSDTHTAYRDPPYPRSWVRVRDDSPAALASGAVASDVLATLTGRGGAAKDVIVSNGPIIRVTAADDPQKGIGTLVRPDATGKVRLVIEVQSAEWAPFDMVEVFANQTFDVVGAAAIGVLRDPSTALQPTLCFTARVGGIGGNDSCNHALGGAQPMTIMRDPVGTGYTRLRAQFVAQIDPALVPQHAGARSGDLWIVVRASGQQGLFPILPYGVATSANLDLLVSVNDSEFFALLEGKGVPAMAITNPIYVDVDGNGWTAPFAP